LFVVLNGWTGKTSLVHCIARLFGVYKSSGFVERLGTFNAKEKDDVLIPEINRAVQFCKEHQRVPVVFFDEIHTCHHNFSNYFHQLTTTYGMNIFFILASNYAADAFIHAFRQTKGKDQDKELHDDRVIRSAMAAKWTDHAYRRISNTIMFQMIPHSAIPHYVRSAFYKYALVEKRIRNADHAYFELNKLSHDDPTSPFYVDDVIVGIFLAQYIGCEDFGLGVLDQVIQDAISDANTIVDFWVIKSEFPAVRKLHFTHPSGHSRCYYFYFSYADKMDSRIHTTFRERLVSNSSSSTNPADSASPPSMSFDPTKFNCNICGKTNISKQNKAAHLKSTKCRTAAMATKNKTA
jgi:hypothetical protein